MAQEMARRRFVGVAAGTLTACLVGYAGADVARAASSGTRPRNSPAPGTVLSPATETTRAVGASRGSDLLRSGDRGPQVLALQQRLTALGYWSGAPDGAYGDLTRQAVIAVQKASGLTRDGVVGPQTRTALASGVRPKARTTRGHVIEVDLRHQLLLMVDGGEVIRILNTSTGSGAHYTAPDGHTEVAVTPTGTFRVLREVDGWRIAPLGRLYRPKYFHGGVAVHGYTSVPAYPASHGCVRVSLPAMDMIWGAGQMPIGTQITVY